MSTSPTTPPQNYSKMSFVSRAKARSVYKRLAAARLQEIPDEKQASTKTPAKS